jgi:exodeoxyribonuclease V beta subunit
MSVATRDFDPTLPLAPGVTVIEASAGTGKTYQITNLVLRLIAEEGLPLERILVVSFTRAATGELLERVRLRIRDAVQVLSRAVSGEGLGDADPFLAWLAGEEPDVRLARLQLAAESLDTAAITTIHSFCRIVLQQHAFESGVDSAVELVESPGDILEELVDDWIVTRLSGTDVARAAFLVDHCGLRRDRLLAIAREVTESAASRVVPEAGAEIDEAVEAAFVADAEAALDDYLERGQSALIEAARRTPASGIFTLKKDGAPQRYFQARLDAFAELLRAAVSGWRALVLLLADGRDDPFAELAEKWPVLDPDTIPGLGDLVALAWRAAALRDTEPAAFAAHVRDDLPRRMERRQRRSFSDLLRLVAEAVTGTSGDPLKAALRKRYQAVLIDEFQDTDASQWAIFRHVFADACDSAGWPSHHLFLIGDPKQAIYAFRGADVHVYLGARDAASARFTMDTNRRSDGRLVAAMNALFRDREHIFAQEGLRYVEVGHDAARHGWDARVREPSGPNPAPLRVRWVDARARVGGGGVAGGEPAPLSGKGSTEQLVARLVADDVVRLLDAGCEVKTRAGFRGVHPGDVAVLVSRNKEASLIADALARRGIPAIAKGRDNIFGTDEAAHVLAFLDAAAEPRDARRARTLAASPLGGWAAPRLAAVVDGVGDPTDWEAWLLGLGALARDVLRRGFAATFQRFLRTPDPLTGLCPLERIAGTRHGERRITNYRQLAELLQRAATEQRLGLEGLAGWLRAQRGGGAGATEAAELRLESDARAVRVVTIHKSKGLQYPFVFAPFLWSARMPSTRDHTLRYHDEAGARVVDVHLDASAEAIALAATEEMQERLRLLYVAVTRAEHRLTVYFPFLEGRHDHARAPLQQTLFPADGPGRAERTEVLFTVPRGGSLDAGPLTAALDRLVAAGHRPDGATVAWDVAAPPGDGALQLDTGSAAPLSDAATFGGEGLERLWRRMSFTSLLAERKDAAAHGAALPGGLPEAAEVVLGGGADEAGAADLPETAPTLDALPLARFPAGTEPGKAVHAIFERLDFQTLTERPAARGGPPGQELQALVAEVAESHGIVEPEHVAALTAQLPVILATPMPLDRPVCLADLPLSDRLDELVFDMSVRGGDLYSGRPQDAASGEAFRRIYEASIARPGVAPPEYVRAVADPGFAPTDLAGFMTGSIDLAFRTSRGADQRWWVLDYKTNKLALRGPDGAWACTMAAYDPAGIRRAMADHHYHLQYHIYLVALHRFLRARLSGYDPEKHLGGAVYAFVRAMDGAATPAGHAVFVDRPPVEIILALDRLLAGEGVEVDVGDESIDGGEVR